MKTAVINTKDISRSWYVVDATDQILGRLASRISAVLMGKTKPAYSPNQDHGDYVIVINCEKVKVTGKKTLLKNYYRHSTMPGNLKITTFERQMTKDPTKIITFAVKGMLPKTNLGHTIIKKLHVFKGAQHEHAAQKPQPLSFK